MYYTDEYLIRFIEKKESSGYRLCHESSGLQVYLYKDRNMKMHFVYVVPTKKQPLVQDLNNYPFENGLKLLSEELREYFVLNIGNLI